MIRILSALGIACVAFAALGQSPAPDSTTAPAPAALPDTDVFVADLDLAAGHVGAPRNVTTRPGYDNQPAFTRDNRALLYVARDDSGSADVWRVDLASRARTQVTTTPEAEYSPTPLTLEGTLRCQPHALRTRRPASTLRWMTAYRCAHRPQMLNGLYGRT